MAILLRNIFSLGATSLISKFGDYWPAVFFFAGFIWDAVTIGRQVAASDLFIFAGYLLIAALILYCISRPSFILADINKLPTKLHWLFTSRLPYFLLQFFYGSLLSALFILYFKSANHWLAWLMAFLLAMLLIANEFLENHYRRFTLSWALFGLCAMLLFNFALPFLLGSVLAIWFYSSTIMGAGLAVFLYRKTPNHLGSIWPVWLIAGLLMLAYSIDMIPPVPLVKREIAIAYQVEKVAANYQLSQQASPWWQFWRKTCNNLQVNSSQRIYFFSSIFAPAGLKTKLFHNWQIYTKHGWVTQSRAGFALNGGRNGGYRGYTYKSNIAAGDWRVRVETENNKTIAIQSFTVEIAQMPADTVLLNY